MIVKSRHVRTSRVSQSKASSALASHFKYIQYRERDLLVESKADRKVFNKERDQVDRRVARDSVMGERAGDIYYHRIILSPYMLIWFQALSTKGWQGCSLLDKSCS
jgi:hypothetical protein